MRKCTKEKIECLFRARIQAIWIDTCEEQVVLQDLKEMIAGSFNGMGLQTWSVATGLTKQAITDLEKQTPPNTKVSSPIMLYSMIQDAQDSAAGESSAYVLLDFHAFADNAPTVRGLRDLKEYPPYRNYNPVIVISPVQKISPELEKLFTIVQYDLPDRQDIEEQLRRIVTSISRLNEKKHQVEVPTEEKLAKITQACIGLTRMEIDNACSKSIVKYRELALQPILDEKIQLVQKSGVLDYITPEYSFEDIGGNKAFKNWMLEAKESFADEAISFGVKPSKGYIGYGIPGSSKSVSAQAMASLMGWPLLSLSMERIMSKHVGESERKIAQALRIVRACAPCVFLIDEVEKALGGVSSSNNVDSGTLSRVVSSCLQFLNEDTGVFVVMTSNDVANLPPALTRSGRLDAQWYFGLPTKEEREEIFRIHFRRIGKEVSDEIIKVGAANSENFTGAEIKDVVKFSLRKAFSRSREDNITEILKQDIVAATRDVIPLYKSAKESIQSLEAYAVGRARNSSGTTEKPIPALKPGDINLFRQIELK